MTDVRPLNRGELHHAALHPGPLPADYTRSLYWQVAALDGDHPHHRRLATTLRAVITEAEAWLREPVPASRDLAVRLLREVGEHLCQPDAGHTLRNT